MNNKQDLIIIGAGLSGLYLATLLQDQYNIIILEARERLGGRILTQEGHDLGPSWIWPHQKHILSLVKELGLQTFSQYTKGEALYDTPALLQRFNAPPSSPSMRIKGGLIKLIDALVQKLPPSLIHINQEVLSMTENDNKISIKTPTKNYEADYVLSTLSPRLACEHISYEPPFPEDMKQEMLNTHTWMGHTAKCVIEFKTAFWKNEGLSGFVYSQVGPLGEIHDASTKDKAALFGFLQAHASTKDIINDVKAQMKRLFPVRVEDIKNIYFVDWRKERFSSNALDHKGLSTHPKYGLSLSHFNKKLLFIGTETAYENGGYLEGALISAQEILKILENISQA
ncbi:FAD-dependent oxidoreductase [Sulfurimonas sp. MAG313]|nr:FAD-dependent oxidoreductase [Sulfurimonas sp. MAG313]MDF1881765.1 FAD-dependent oxidoreductase [Sulfurimonas sp. MAG313]